MKNKQITITKGILISLFSLIFTLFFMGCDNPFWTLDKELAGTININPATPKAGDTVYITYTPGTGEPAFPGG